MKCVCCKSKNIVLATVEKTGKRIAVCCECDYIYDLDSKGRPIRKNKNKNPSYLRELHSSFKSWKELVDVVPLK